MDLYKEILVKILENKEIKISFENLNINPTEIVKCASFRALQKIKAIILDDSLDDSECFIRIEEIIRLFEDLGSDGGTRHDF